MSSSKQQTVRSQNPDNQYFFEIVYYSGEPGDMALLVRVENDPTRKETLQKYTRFANKMRAELLSNQQPVPGNLFVGYDNQLAGFLSSEAPA